MSSGRTWKQKRPTNFKKMKIRYTTTVSIISKSLRRGISGYYPHRSMRVRTKDAGMIRVHSWWSPPSKTQELLNLAWRKAVRKNGTQITGCDGDWWIELEYKRYEQSYRFQPHAP